MAIAAGPFETKRGVVGAREKDGVFRESSMAFRTHDRFHLMVGREIKQTLNAGGCGDLARNGAGLAMLNLGNGEVDVFFGKRTLD